MLRNRYPEVHDNSKPELSKAKKRKISYRNFGSYCTQLFKQSMITGIPEIASSKSKLSRSINGIVFLICFAGFTYQTYSFMKMFLKYPTIIDIKDIIPDTIEAPAVTVCNRNRLRRNAYCTELPKICRWWTDAKESFCIIHPIYCPENEVDPVFAVPDPRYITNGNLSLALLNLTGQRQEDLIKYQFCSILTDTARFNCSKIMLVPSVKDGFPHNCYSIKSLWGNPHEAQLQIPVTSQHNIMLEIHPEEYVDRFDLHQVYIHIHDPHSITNAFEEGVILQAGKTFKMNVKMEHRQSLPPPYDTNCTDYKEIWRENGGHGPLTKRSCIEECKIEAMVKEFGCVSRSIWYPNNYTLCAYKSTVPSKELNDMCTRNCNDPCDEKIYFITTVEEEDTSRRLCNETDVGCKHKSVNVSIRFSRMVITQFKYGPKFQDVEMFSYIGGYIGMWLGISLVALFDFLETLADILAYPVRKLRKRRKVTKRIENTHRNSMFNIYDY